VTQLARLFRGARAGLPKVGVLREAECCAFDEAAIPLFAHVFAILDDDLAA
jgi:hypothetical protein